jgi:hypothetical protein
MPLLFITTQTFGWKWEYNIQKFQFNFEYNNIKNLYFGFSIVVYKKWSRQDNWDQFGQVKNLSKFLD